MWGWGRSFPGSGAVVVAGVFATVAFSALRRGEGLRELGFRLDNFLPAMKDVALVTAPLVAVLLIAGAGFDRVRPDWLQVVLKLPKLVAWGLVQQTILQGFVHRRLREALTSSRHVDLATAAFFALCHLPNVRLMAGTFVGGWAWSAIYRRNPNLFALSIAHALGSAALNIAFGPELMRNMRVGGGYFTYER